jgi:hypothetical protein
MHPKEKLFEDLNWLSDKISSQVWTINLGTLATTWSLLIAAGSGERKLQIGSTIAILIILICIVAMLCELGQYYAGYFDALSIKKELERSGEEKFEYDETTWLYMWRNRLFYVKALLSLTVAILLVVVLAGKLI